MNPCNAYIMKELLNKLDELSFNNLELLDTVNHIKRGNIRFIHQNSESCLYPEPSIIKHKTNYLKGLDKSCRLKLL